MHAKMSFERPAALRTEQATPADQAAIQWVMVLLAGMAVAWFLTIAVPVVQNSHVQVCVNAHCATWHGDRPMD